jgi:hypothetical protein
MGGTHGAREERTMATIENGLFAGLPRRGRLGGAVTIALWLVLCGAFLTDAVPTRSSEEWLYDVEARRDEHARVLAARSAQPVRSASLAPGRDALGAVAPARTTVLAAATAPAADCCSCQ